MESAISEIRLRSGRAIGLDRTLIVGVLNVTPDSFSDGGQFSTHKEAVERALRMEEEGADVVDVGGESSRPGSEPIDPMEELDRVIPVIEGIRSRSEVPISVDTYRSHTAREAIDAGADIVNDISGLRFDTKMASFLAMSDVPVVLMHMKGIPRTMQKNPHYTDCISEIADYFDERISYASSKGINRERLILDPGVGFGKRLEDNLDVISNLSSFRRFGLPLMIGTSRKSFIAAAGGVSRSAADRVGGSIASTMVAVLNGADIVRVHDVIQTVEALRVLEAIRGRS